MLYNSTEHGHWSNTTTYEHLPNKWVFKINQRLDGSIDRYKACSVMNGFHQHDGLDFIETFSPIVKHTTIRTIIALAFHHHWPIRPLDVHNSFLHGFLTEEVYMQQPAWFIDSNFSHHVCHLHKSLYYLKQVARA